MTTSLWLVAAIACAQTGAAEEPAGATEQPVPAATPKEPERVPPPRPATSRITAVTVYRGQALVNREVVVPEADGTVELVVTPLPHQAVDSSLYAEGSEGVRVLSARFRTRAVPKDTRAEVRQKEAELQELKDEILRIQNEIAVGEQDLQYLQKLEGFTTTTLNGLTAKGRLDDDAAMNLSRFVMENRGARSKEATGLRRQLAARTEAATFASRQLAELSAGSSRIERDAVVVVRKGRREAGTVRLGYLVNAAGWSPQYRLRGAADDTPVKLEYLAAVTQQSGEDWPDVAVTLSTARPSLDAAPPELLPLEMAVADNVDAGPVEAKDDRSRAIVAALENPIPLSFANETPLEDVLKYIRTATAGPALRNGIPIYVDPEELVIAEKTMASPVRIELEQVPLRRTLKLLLAQLGLVYRVGDGMVSIFSENSEALRDDAGGPFEADAGMTAGAAPAGQSAAPELNRAAASEQAEELRIVDGRGAEPPAAEKDEPGVTFAVAGKMDIPSRRDPQLLEVARVALPAEYYAKAVPVLTPRFYRLAKLTNTSDMVLLPGEAAVYAGSDFVGRMRLPLVAVGEPFVAGFGVDPQLQVSRRLIRKARSVQGGNQIYTYEFRIGVRNYRSTPVKVQLWDRLPKPKGEAVAVNLVTTSAELSTDALYLRTARMDNLLRWDLDIPKGTIGDKTRYLNYEFRMEYARDLPRPQFLAGGLKEGPIGGGAMGLGGMGGMGGGFKSVDPAKP